VGHLQLPHSHLESVRLGSNSTGLNHGNEDGDVTQGAALSPGYTHPEGVTDTLREGDQQHQHNQLFRRWAVSCPVVLTYGFLVYSICVIFNSNSSTSWDKIPFLFSCLTERKFKCAEAPKISMNSFHSSFYVFCLCSCDPKLTPWRVTNSLGCDLGKLLEEGRHSK